MQGGSQQECRIAQSVGGARVCVCTRILPYVRRSCCDMDESQQITSAGSFAIRLDIARQEFTREIQHIVVVPKKQTVCG